MPEHFEYFYGSEAEQFAFYRIPKSLMTDPQFAGVSLMAKLLYGLLRHCSTSGRTTSVISEIISADTLKPYMSSIVDR